MGANGVGAHGNVAEGNLGSVGANGINHPRQQPKGRLAEKKTLLSEDDIAGIKKVRELISDLYDHPEIKASRAEIKKKIFPSKLKIAAYASGALAIVVSLMALNAYMQYVSSKHAISHRSRTWPSRCQP